MPARILSAMARLGAAAFVAIVAYAIAAATYSWIDAHEYREVVPYWVAGQAAALAFVGWLGAGRTRKRDAALIVVLVSGALGTLAGAAMLRGSSEIGVALGGLLGFGSGVATGMIGLVPVMFVVARRTAVASAPEAERAPVDRGFPHALLPVLEPVRIVIASLALLAFDVGQAALLSPSEAGLRGLLSPLASAFVAALFAIAIRLAFRAKTRGAVLASAVGLPAIILAAAAFLADLVAGSSSWRLIGLAFVTGAGLIGGAGGGLVAIVPVLYAERMRGPHGPVAHDAPDRVMVVSGAWCALITIAIGLTQSFWTTGWHSYFSEVHPFLPVLVALYWFAALAELAVFAIGAARLVRRKRWLAAVRRGEVNAYRIVSADAAPDATLLPLFAGRHGDAVLVHDEAGSAPGYRAMARPPVPVARVPGS